MTNESKIILDNHQEAILKMKNLNFL